MATRPPRSTLFIHTFNAHPSQTLPLTFSKGAKKFILVFLSTRSLNESRGIQERTPTPANLDFDARVPIPISVFPSTYKNDTTTTSTDVNVQEEVQIQKQTSAGGREGIETLSYTAQAQTGPRTQTNIYEQERITTDRYPNRGQQNYTSNVREDIRVNVNDDSYRRNDYDLDVERTRYRQPFQRYADTQIYDREYATFNQGSGQEQVAVDSKVTVEETTRRKRDMGYYDESGNYHSFRQGLHNAAERVLHPLSGGNRYSSRENIDVDVDVDVRTSGSRPAPRIREEMSFRTIERSYTANTITIPCHHINIGDLLILQGRPCQVIKITTSAHTGQHRYLGVDLFSKQLYEESSFSSNPSPSVYVQNMLGPVFKQYRILDMSDDGTVTAMTETGDIKQRLAIIDQGSLWERLNASFANGRGSVRVLVINDNGRELGVDYKVVHGSRL